LMKSRVLEHTTVNIAQYIVKTNAPLLEEHAGPGVHGLELHLELLVGALHVERATAIEAAHQPDLDAVLEDRHVERVDVDPHGRHDGRAHLQIPGQAHGM